MEYYPQGDITHSLESIRGKTKLIKQIFRGILEGVRFMHEECLIAHLDIKPCNILLTKNMIPIITDFGTCRPATTP